MWDHVLCWASRWLWKVFKKGNSFWGMCDLTQASMRGLLFPTFSLSGWTCWCLKHLLSMKDLTIWALFSHSAHVDCPVSYCNWSESPVTTCYTCWLTELKLKTLYWSFERTYLSFFSFAWVFSCFFWFFWADVGEVLSPHHLTYSGLSPPWDSPSRCCTTWMI